MSALSLNAVRTVAPQNSPFCDRLDEHGRNPPPLQSAVDHEAGEEEADQQRRLHVDLRLIGGGGAGETDEEQEAADEQSPGNAR